MLLLQSTWLRLGEKKHEILQYCICELFLLASKCSDSVPISNDNLKHLGHASLDTHVAQKGLKMILLILLPK